MKKLTRITLLISFLVSLGMPSFAAHDPIDSVPPKTIVRSPLPATDPFADETDTDVAPTISTDRGNSVNTAIPTAPTPRTQRTIHRVTRGLADDLGLAPPSPRGSTHKPSTQGPSNELSTPTETAAPTKVPSVKSITSTHADTQDPAAEAAQADTPPSRRKSGLFSCFPCVTSKSAAPKTRSLSLMAQNSEGPGETQPTIVETITGLITTDLTEGEAQPLPRQREGYEPVSADPEDDTETPGTAPQPAALLSGTAPSEEASTEAVGASGSTETDPAEPETVSVTAAAPDTALVAKDSEGNPLPESLDEGIQPASAQPTPAATKKAKTSWLRSCWPKAKKTAVVVKKNLQEAFVDIAPYLEDGLKLVAASSPNPAIQSVINFSAILIREASSAMTQDGATFDLTTKNGRKVTVASPPLLHAHNFSNNGNLSEESKMVISIILHRTAPVLNYEDLIGFINMVVAQDNDSPETIRFDPISGNISLYPNNMATQPVLLSVPILESIKNPADRETTSHILLEYVAATEDRALAEKVLRSRLGSNFLPTPASWVRSTFQQLVERNSPFVLDRTLSIEGKIDLSIREAVSEREAQLKISEPETIVRVPLARKS